MRMSVPPVLPKSLAPIDPARLPLSAKIIALAGERAQVHPLLLQSLCVRAARGERLALVVGDNHFDAYRLARLARARGFDPAALLTRIELSRAFTCYQLYHRIAMFAADPKPQSNALYIIGLLETYYDEDVREPDARRLLRQSLAQLKIIAARGLPILVTLALPHQPGREAFVEIVKHAAGAYWQPIPAVLDQFAAQQLTLAGMG